MNFLNSIPDEEEITVYDVMIAITPENWKPFAKNMAIRTTADTIYENKRQRVLEILDQEGAFVRMSELAEEDVVQYFGADTERKYAGYIDYGVVVDNYKSNYANELSMNRQKYMFQASIVLVVDDDTLVSTGTRLHHGENVILNESLQRIYDTICDRRIDRRIPMEQEFQPNFFIGAKCKNRIETDIEFIFKVQNQNNERLTTPLNFLPWQKGVNGISAYIFNQRYLQDTLETLTDKEYILEIQSADIRRAFELNKQAGLKALANCLHENGKLYTIPVYKPDPLLP